MVHALLGTPDDLPDAGEGACCEGSGISGPRFCTCWRQVYDLEQTRPDPMAVKLLAAGIEPVTRKTMCGDCAYRPDSPERTGLSGYVGDAAELERIAAEAQFWCHQGMRRAVAWRHPSGVEVTGHPAGYQPPVVDGVPYQADGRPGELCAGWAARRRALDSPSRREGA